MRKICDVSHERNIVALCKKDQMLICNDCLKAGHLDHQRVFISTLAKNILSYSQEVLNSADDAVQNLDYVISNMNKDDVVAALRAKIEEAFEQAMRKLSEFRDHLLDEVLACGAIREIVQCSQEMGEHDKRLRETQKEVEGARQEIERLIDQKNYIGVIDMQAQLSSYETQIAELGEVVNGCTVRLQGGICRVQALAQEAIVPDIAPEKFLNQEFLEKLQGQQSPTPSKRLPQQQQLDCSVTTPGSARYTLKQSLETLLVGIENTHGKGISIFNVATGAGHTLRFSRDFKVPLNFAAIEKPGDTFVYITGGWAADRYKADNYEYALLQGKVTRRSPMKVPRRAHAGTYCQGVVVCGGENSQGHLSSCEAFDVEKNAWSELPNLNERKSYCTACSMNDSRVYVFGGYTNVNGVQKKFDTIEVLDLAPSLAAGWTLIKLAKKTGWSARQDVGAVQVSETQILLFGGHNGTALRDAFMFNTENGEMATAGSMAEGDQFYQRTPKLVCERVHVMGSNPAHVLFYDLKSQKWGIVSASSSSS